MCERHGLGPGAGAAGHAREWEGHAAERKRRCRKKARTRQRSAQRPRDARQRSACSDRHRHQQRQRRSHPPQVARRVPAPAPGDAHQRQQAHQCERTPGQGQLARQRARSAHPAPCAQPFAQRAVAQFAAHRPGASGHGQNVQQGGDQRRAQKLLVVAGHIEQRHHLRVDGLHAHVHGLGAFAALVARGHFDTRRQGAHGRAHIALQQARVGGHLCVVQQRDLCSAAFLHGARKVARDGNHGVHVHRPQRAFGLGRVGEVLGDLYARRGVQHAHQLARQAGVVVVRHAHRQVARQAGREDPPQERHAQQRHPGDHGQVPRVGRQAAGLAAEAVDY